MDEEIPLDGVSNGRGEKRNKTRWEEETANPLATCYAAWLRINHENVSATAFEDSLYAFLVGCMVSESTAEKMLFFFGSLLN